MTYARHVMRLSQSMFRRRCLSTNTGKATRDESREDAIFLAYSVFGSTAALLLVGFGAVCHLDGKIGRYYDKSEAKFESLRSELRDKVDSLRSDVRNSSDKSDAKFERLRNDVGKNSDKSDEKFESLRSELTNSSAKSDAKVESLRGELRNARSELLNAISNTQGETTRASEEVADEQKK